MLIEETVKTKVTPNMVEYYRSKGYNCVVGEYIFVKTSDLTTKSNVKVRYICDKCGEIITIRYCDYNRRHKEQKDCCNRCKYEKAKKTNLIRYGSENVMGNNSIRERLVETNIKRYGYDSAMKNKDISDKAKKTCMERYGVDNPAKSNIVKEKIIKTDMERYGVKHHLSSKEVIDKRIETNLKRYGVPHVLMSPEIIEKSRRTLYENGSCPTSKQQIHIHSIYGGKLNYPIGRTNVDIFFEESNIYCEYDGGGHRYMVFSKIMSDKEFTNREIRRGKYLESIGLKEFRIISKSDTIPSDDTLIDMKNFAFHKLLDEGYNWIKFDIDNGFVSYKGCQEPYKFN